MSWESIGDCGGGQWPDDEDWVRFGMNLGIAYLKFAVGKPPPGTTLGIMFTEYDIGLEGEISEYPTIGLWGDTLSFDAMDYVCKCQDVLALFNDAVDWEEMGPEAIADTLAKFDDDDDDDDEDEEDDEA